MNNRVRFKLRNDIVSLSIPHPFSEWQIVFIKDVKDFSISGIIELDLPDFILKFLHTKLTLPKSNLEFKSSGVFKYSSVYQDDVLHEELCVYWTLP